MDIEKLKDEAAMFLEEMHVSGDAMIDMDHCLDELPEEKQGAYYLHDLMASFFEQRLKTSQHEPIVMQKPFIRRYFELLKLTEEDCSCGRIAKCDSCCAASVLNEVEELIKTEHGRLFA